MVEVRALGLEDRPFVVELLRTRWGSERMVANGAVFRPADHEGFLATMEGKPAGVLTYRIDGDRCEVTLIDSLREGRGVGSALLSEVTRAAKAAGCSRLWLVTTNDNLHALRFYQRRGFRLVALRPGAIDRARRELKPEISPVGLEGIPIHDDLELERWLE
jgi:ribosomal protein S18 acetylase RimI-like enzyme